MPAVRPTARRVCQPGARSATVDRTSGRSGASSGSPARTETPSSIARPDRTATPSAPSPRSRPLLQETVLLNATVRARDALRRLRPDRTPSTSPRDPLPPRCGAWLLTRTVDRRGSTPSASPPDAIGRSPTARTGVTRRERLARRLGLTPARTAALRARFAGRERLLPIGVALLVLVGSMSAIAVPPPTGAVGGTTGGGEAPRLAVAGLENGERRLRQRGRRRRCDRSTAGAARLDLSRRRQRRRRQPDGPVPGRRHPAQADRRRHVGRRRAEHAAHLPGPVRRHADRHRPPLRRVDDDPVVGQPPQVEGRLKVGQKLVIPPVDGTVHVVKAGRDAGQDRRCRGRVGRRHHVVQRADRSTS